MLGTVISNLRQLVISITTLMFNVMALIRQQLFKITGVLADLKIQYALQLNLSSLRAQIVSSISRLRVSLIIVEQSIKAVLITAKATVTQIGLLLLTTVRKILQLVRKVLLQSKDKLVAYIKLVQLRFSVTTFAQTPMVVQLIQGGEKLLGTVRQLPLHAKALLKVKR